MVLIILKVFFITFIFISLYLLFEVARLVIDDSKEMSLYILLFLALSLFTCCVMGCLSLYGVI